MEKTEKNPSLDMDEPLRRLKVLLWDDEADGKKETLFKEIFLGLKNQGWAPTIEKSSSHALERVLKEQYDAVVLDLLEDGKPVGLELLKKIRAEKPFLPIVMFTISREMKHLKAAVRGEVSYYLEFPVTGYHEVIKAVEVAIDREKTKKKMMDERYYTSLGQLAGGVAHFIKNSLWNISSRVELLLEKTDAESDAYDMLETIKRRSDEANKVVINLLNYARYERDDEILKKIDIAKVLKSILDLLEIEFRYHRIKLDQKFSSPHLCILGNEFLLREAFLNIIKNSIEAMPNGGELKISVQENDATLEIDIEDTGIGIPSKLKDKIFIPFFSTKEKATGFGLFETQRIIAKHSGEINISSTEGKGTKVSLNFPLK